MQVQVQTITPDYAAALLAKNTSNRPFTSSHADTIANGIRRGEWKLNGDAIRISDDGVLLDGQHRLTAIVRAGVPVQSVVIGGLPRDVFDTIDIGAKRRSTADVLAIHGEKHYTTLSAAAYLCQLGEGKTNSARSSQICRLKCLDQKEHVSEHWGFLLGGFPRTRTRRCG